MITFVLDKRLGDDLIAEVQGICDLGYRDRVSIEPASPILGLDLQTVSSLAATIVAIISLCLQIREEHSERKARTQWTAERFYSFVETELLKLGVTNAGPLEVSNFEALVKETEEPCVVRVVIEDTGIEVTLQIFHDGDVYRIVESPGSIGVSHSE